MAAMGRPRRAGGLVDGATWNAGAFLAAADSASYLARHAAHFTTGPTGTNVMDLALALRGSAWFGRVSRDILFFPLFP